MHSISFLVFLVAIFQLCVAVPMPASKDAQVMPRSFIVPRQLNPKLLGKRKTGSAAMAKAFRKYGWAGQIAVAKPTNGTNGTENGVVAALPEDNDALFLSPVTVGGQQLNLDFDTGSSDLWVFSTRLSQRAVGAHTAFDEKNSSTFQLMQDATFLVTYGDGSGAAGLVGTDTVDIGGATVTSQAVEIATAISQSFAQDINTDGLVGLAFGKLNTVMQGNLPAPQKTFFESVAPTLGTSVFTADLTNDTTGTYEFGRIDASKFQGNLSWTQVNSTLGFWQVESNAFAVGGQVMQNPGASPAILDTGTSLLLVDPALAQAYYSAVPSAQLSAQAGGFVYPCADAASLPSLALAVGPDYMAEIPGDQITFAPLDETNQTCFGGVQSNGGAGLMVMGDTLFKAQFVAFELTEDGGRVGLAPKN